MAAADYLGELKNRLAITDTEDDAVLKGLLGAALGMVEDYTGRTFSAATATRYFTAETPGRCEIDDLITLTTLATDGQGNLTYSDTWASTDYQLEPPNSTPKRWIILHPTGVEAFPTHANAVKVTGSFGYAATPPEPVREAVLLEASRMFQQSQSPSGVVASAELGAFLVAPQLHPTTRALLMPFVRMDVRA